MAGGFQKIVLTVAIIVFILLLIFIGAVLYQNKYGSAFPPFVSNCPDYWKLTDLSNNMVCNS